MALQTETVEHLQCKKLSLVNDAGETIISLASDPTSGGGGISILNADGNPVVYITADSDQQGLITIANANREQVAHIGCNPDGGNLLLRNNGAKRAAVYLAAEESGGFMDLWHSSDVNTVQRFILGMFGPDGVLCFSDRNNEPLAVLRANNECAALGIRDVNGNIVWFPPISE